MNHSKYVRWLVTYVDFLVKIDINAGITNEAIAVKTPFPTCGFDKICLFFFIEYSGSANLLI